MSDRAAKRAARRKTMDKVLIDVLGVEETDMVVLALNQEGCRNVEDILSLQDRDIDNMHYVDPDSKKRSPVVATQRNLLKILKAWNYSLLVSEDRKKVDWDDPSYVNSEMFDEFRVTAYDPDVPIRTIPRSSTSLKGLLPRVTSSGGSKSPAQRTQAEEFRRGIKRDKAHYEALRDEKQWDSWKRKTESTATTHGCENILDPKFEATTVDDIALFDAQQTFMFDVFMSTLKLTEANIMCANTRLPRMHNRCGGLHRLHDDFHEGRLGD